MNLTDITPLVLTYNEAPNIGRCLEQLRWAARVVVVDSFSTDDTLSIVRSFPNVEVHQRAFDDFAGQLNWALEETSLTTPWVMALDADYLVPEALVEELRRLETPSAVSAYYAEFVYQVFGHPLRSGIYPAVGILFRRGTCRYLQDGHAYRLRVVEGTTSSLTTRMIHDDRKPLARWLQSQANYMEQESQKLLAASPGQLGLTDRIRTKIVVAPWAALFYCLIVRRGLFDGWAGWYYALQRATAETILSLKLLEHKLLGRTS